jgi:hypothetical protein
MELSPTAPVGKPSLTSLCMNDGYKVSVVQHPETSYADDQKYTRGASGFKEGIRRMQCESRNLQDWVGNGLSSYERSLWIDYLPELPRTATGTLQRFKLHELQRAAGVRLLPVKMPVKFLPSPQPSAAPGCSLQSMV